MENLITLNNLEQELELDSNTITIKNFESIKAQLEQDLKSYNPVNIDYKTAKDNKAFLNKVSKAIDDKRIKTEKDFTSVLSTFKTQCKELKEMVDNVSNNLKTIVDDTDNKFKTERYNELKEYYNRGNEFKFIDFDEVLQSKWLTKTMKIEDAKKELDDLLFDIFLKVAVLEKSYHNEELNLILYCFFYKCDRDITKTMKMYDDIKDKMNNFKFLVNKGK